MKNRFKLIAAVHLFLIKEDKILLSRRFQTGYEDGNYSVIAGHLEGNEEIKSAMLREAKEEAGIQIQITDLNVVGIMHRKTSDERIDFFLATTKWQGEIYNAEPHKCDDLTWFNLTDLPNNVVSYVRQAIENYKHRVWFDSFGWE